MESHTTKEGIKRKLGASIILSIAAPKLQCNSTDHTPTPTRFIRNCEEVGLFQDLQNVNPFDEGFRKALKETNPNEKPPMKDDKTTTDNDDTLHTPNILPHITIINNSKQNSNVSPNQIGIIKKATHKKSFDDNDNTNDFNLLIQCDEDDTQEHSLNNLKSNGVKTKTNQNTITKEKNISSKTIRNQKSSKGKDYVSLRRESNRVSQIKSRQRQKETMNQIIDELKKLRKENEALKRENLKLWEENKMLVGNQKEIHGKSNETTSGEKNLTESENKAEKSLKTTNVASNCVTKSFRTILPKVSCKKVNLKCVPIVISYK